MARRLIFRAHAVARMVERAINVDDVRTVVNQGERIEVYPTDASFPSRLMLGWPGGQPLHVVAADDPQSDIAVVITAYRPDQNLWEPEFPNRRP